MTISNTSNAFELTLTGANHRIKWDALMNCLRWLFNRDAPHGLGPAFQERIVERLLGEGLYLESPDEFGKEFKLGEGAGTWPDIGLLGERALVIVEDVASPSSGDKQDRLPNYLRFARAEYHDYQIGLLLITTSSAKDQVHGMLDRQLAGSTGTWHLISLHEIAQEIRACDGFTEVPESEGQRTLCAFVEWAEAL